MPKPKLSVTPMRAERPHVTTQQAKAEAMRLAGDPRSVRIVAKVSETERRKLKGIALEQGVELQQLILDAIAAQHPGVLDA